jgi:hypothetical protein
MPLTEDLRALEPHLEIYIYISLLVFHSLHASDRIALKNKAGILGRVVLLGSVLYSGV